MVLKTDRYSSGLSSTNVGIREIGSLAVDGEDSEGEGEDENPDVKKEHRDNVENINCTRDNCTFEGTYESVEEILGRGATGFVRAYKHRRTGKDVAVKIVETNDSVERRRVLKEIDTHFYCKNHPNIVKLLEYVEDNFRFYLIFEKMEGGTLLSSIERLGHFNESQASQVICQVADAIHFMHTKGIAHRDLKLENILCRYSHQILPVAICDLDLGSGKKIGSTPELMTPVGSAEYMAPEVVDVWTDKSCTYTKKCDLWSLGVIMYILLCGYPPFIGDCGLHCGWSQGQYCPSCGDLFKRIQSGHYVFPDAEWCGVSSVAKDLISHLLVIDPERRYAALQVLNHPWCRLGGNRGSLLSTPLMLSRNSSVRDLEAFAEETIAIQRIVEKKLILKSSQVDGDCNFKMSCFDRDTCIPKSDDSDWSVDEQEAVRSNDDDFCVPEKEIMVSSVMNGDGEGLLATAARAAIRRRCMESTLISGVSRHLDECLGVSYTDTKDSDSIYITSKRHRSLSTADSEDGGSPCLEEDEIDFSPYYRPRVRHSTLTPEFHILETDSSRENSLIYKDDNVDKVEDAEWENGGRKWQRNRLITLTNENVEQVMLEAALLSEHGPLKSRHNPIKMEGKKSMTKPDAIKEK